MSEKTLIPNKEEQRPEEISDAEMTEVAGGTDSRGTTVEAIKSDSNRTALEGGEGFDFVQVNGSNTAGDDF